MVLGQKYELGLPGLAPLETSKKKFEKLYGPPVEKSPENKIFKYRTETQLIEVTYTSKPCSNERYGSYRVKQDTVLSATVYFLSSVKVSELKFDIGKFTMDDSGDFASIFRYLNPKEGITIRISIDGDDQQYLQAIDYYPNQDQERRQKCG